MTTHRPNDRDTGWIRLTDSGAALLDDTFPLAEGSHHDAADYLVQQGHLLVIRADGGCTGLARPEQFCDVEGDHQAPDAVLLAHAGLQVEIEPGRRARAAGAGTGHRVHLLGRVEPQRAAA